MTDDYEGLDVTKQEAEEIKKEIYERARKSMDGISGSEVDVKEAEDGTVIELLKVNKNRQKLINVISKEFPETLFNIISDHIIGVRNEKVTSFEFYKFASKNGFIECCTQFINRLYRKSEEDEKIVAKLKEWAEQHRAEHGIKKEDTKIAKDKKRLERELVLEEIRERRKKEAEEEQNELKDQ